MPRLPLPLTSLVGRERETADVRRLVADARLVTLTGPGGCGKTRLALAVADDIGHSEVETWWVELAGLMEPELVAQAVAGALDLRGQPGRSVEDSVRARLADSSGLVVLDNCEHLLDACAALVADLLTSCPGLRVLATSRARLALTGERVWPVPPLSVPDPANPPPLASLGRYEGVRLFVERARAVEPGFALDGATAAAVATVCRRLDGLPLAIELAAARVRVLTVTEIAARIGDAFALLTSNTATAPARQRTLRAAIEWSHRLLDEPGRVLLRRLAAFAGGATLDAAEVVCAGGPIARSQVLDGLTTLSDCSLVLVDKREGRSRFRLLETVRQFGQEELAASGDEPAVRRRHVEHLVALAEDLGPRINTPDRDRALALLGAEDDDLRAALRWSLDARDRSGPRLAAALPWFWWFTGRLDEGRRWFAQAMAVDAGDPRVAATVLTAAGLFGWSSGDPAARDVLDRAVARWRGLGDPVRLAEALRILSATHELAGEPDSARRLVAESVALCRGTDDPFALAMALGRLGITAITQGDHDGAAAALDEAAEIARRAGDDWVLALVLRHRGIGALRLGDLGLAADVLAEAIGRLRGRGERLLSVQCVETLAAVHAAAGDHRRAARLFGALAAQRAATGMGVIYRVDLDKGVATARTALGAAAAGLEAEGAVLSWDQVLDTALGRPRQREVPGGLTEREADILALVAQGMTNAEVAVALFLSARTVNWHLTSVYGKLGVRSRTEATRYALDHGLAGRG